MFSAGAIAGELKDLCRAGAPGRRHRDQITVFKSVGTALGDWIAAQQVLKQS